uniref:Putative nucleotidyltransferase MAB21L1 n=1 Tax=Chrysemys picta bellii TaxID=8478 RepID=A0A8C3FS10_CHRPI|nr:uncharacterized protein LOC101941187 isoform X2 [Chrysemys picta bellii]
MADKSEDGAQGPGEMEEKEALCRLASQTVMVYHLWKQARQPVQDVVRDIIASVCKSQKSILAREPTRNVLLFMEEPILVGSRAQGIHVLAESGDSDYDFLVPIQYEMNLSLKGSRHGKLHTLKGCLPRKENFENGVPVYLWENKVMVDITETKNYQQLWKNSLDPKSVMKEFWECVQKALTEDRFRSEQEQRRDRDASASQPGNVRLKNMDIKPKCPAVQLSAEVDGQAVSIDLVPTIRTKVDISMDWPRQDLRWLSDWWDWEQGTERIKPTWNIGEIYKTGTDLVAKGSYWRLTFSRAETQLLKDIDADGGCRRKALRVLKQINMEKWVPRYGKVLTSYHLKTVLFWASDLNPETEHWATVPDAVETLLKVLEFCLEKKHLPSYFLRSINFFNWHRTEEENSLKNLGLEVLRLEVRLMRCSPERYLQLSDDLAKLQGPGPFVQRAQELAAFRREHRKDLEKLRQPEIPDDSVSMDGD